MGKKVSVLVNNSVNYDNRVLQIARTLANAGFEVEIFGRPCAVDEPMPTDVTIHRYPHFKVPKIIIAILKSSCFEPSVARWIAVFFLLLFSPLVLLTTIMFSGITILQALVSIVRVLLPQSWLERGGFMKSPLMLIRSVLVAGYQATSNWLFKVAYRYIIPAVIIEEVNASFYQPVLDAEADFLHANDLETLRLALRVAKKTGAKVIYDSHEYERERNDRPFYFQRLIIRAEEWQYVSHADHVITVSAGIAELMKRDHSIALPTVINNSPSITSTTASDVRRDIGLADDVPLLLYVGIVSIDRCLDDITRALLQLPGWHFVTVGPFREDSKRELLALADQLGVAERIHILPPVKGHEVISYIRTASVGIIAAHNLGKSYEFSLPNKLFEMTLARLPVVVSNLTAMRQFAKQHHLGECLPEGITAENIAATVLSVHENRDQYTAREWRDAVITEYSWEQQAQKLVSVYTELALPSHQTIEKDSPCADL